MIGIGVILDIAAGMKPVACGVDDNSSANALIGGPELVRNLPADTDSYPRHVLVVDDEPLIRWSVCETLSDLGCEVEQAADAGSTLRRVSAAARPFDVVLLDLRLPDMSDLSLLWTLRQLLPGATLILMTAFGTPEIVGEARALGAGVLDKPFEMDLLRRLASEPGTEAK